MNRRNILIFGKNGMDLELIKSLLKIKNIFAIEEIILNVNIPQSIYITPIYYWKKFGLKVAANDQMYSWWASFGIGVDYPLNDAISKTDVLVFFDNLKAVKQDILTKKKIIISDKSDSDQYNFSFFVNEEILPSRKLIIPNGLDYAISYFTKVLLEYLRNEFKIKSLRFLTDLKVGKDELYGRLSKVYPFIDLKKVIIETYNGGIKSTKDKKIVKFELIDENEIETQKFINSLEKLDFITFTDRKNVYEVNEVERLLECEYNIFYPFILSIPSLEVADKNILRGKFYINHRRNEIFNIIFALIKFFFPRSVNDKMSKILNSGIRRI